MAVVVGTVNCAENYQKVAILGSAVGDPIVPGLGCLNENDFDTVDAASVALFYEAALAKGDPASAPAPYNLADAANSLINIPMNNYFDDAKRIYSAQMNSLPYDKAATELTKQANKAARQNGTAELACLINEGTSKSGTAITDSNINSIILADISAIRGTGANPGIAVCSPEFYAKLVLAAGKSFDTNVGNELWMNAVAGRYLGVTWIESPLFAAGMKYNDSTGTAKTVDGSGIEYVMWDGSKFAAVNRINEFAIKDGGALFSGVAACMTSQLGVKVLEKGAVIARSGE